MVTFDSLNLPAPILQSLTRMGFTEPTPIQAAVLPLLLEGRDAVAQAQTGTGKTAAFGIPAVVAALTERAAIVMVPTRELCQQVTAEIDRIGAAAGVHALALYGGAPFGPQARALESGRYSILVATPGRLRDHLQRGTLDAEVADLVVLDEADELLNMGFVEEIEEILDAVGPDRQTLLFSATMPPRVRELARKYMKDAEHVNVRGANDRVATADTEQFVMFVDQYAKTDALVRVLAVEAPTGAIVFRHTRDSVDALTQQLAKKGVTADALHGGLAQAQREAVLARLRDGRVKVVVATDVAARGLDVDTLTHVINYDVPQAAEAYVHRIGRTGRAGRTGRSILFVAPFERGRLRGIERVLKMRPEVVQVPPDEAVHAVVAERTRAWLAEAATTAPEADAALIAELVASGVDAAGLAAALLARVRTHERLTAPPLEPLRQNRRQHPRPHQAPRARSNAMTGPTVALVVNAGRMDRVRAGDVVGALTNEGGLVGQDIGRIDLLPHMSVAEIPADRANDVIVALKNATLRGRPAQARVATDWRFRDAAEHGPN